MSPTGCVIVDGSQRGLGHAVGVTNDTAASGRARSGHSTVLVAGACTCLYLLLFAGGLVGKRQ